MTTLKLNDFFFFFISSVSKIDETLGGFIFETIVNGLIIFGYSKSIKIENYGISVVSVKCHTLI